MDTAAIRTAWIGKVIEGRFTLLRWLGGSEEWGVFLTEYADPPRQAAIKLIPANDPDAEAQAALWPVAAALSHPHLMRLIHSGSCEVDDVPLLYSVTEYAEENLSQVLPERPLTASEAAEMLDPVLDALAYLHGKGLVHGRVRPSNILVVDNEVKISSDSLHRVGEPARRSRVADDYDAPESAAAPAAPSADIWALGVTLVEALAQRPPAWDRSAQSAPVVPDFIPQPLAGIARDCLRTDPLRRCSVNEIKARLHPGAAVPTPAAKAAKTGPGKLGVTAMIVGAVVLLLVAAGIYLRSHRAEPGFPADKRLALSQPAVPDQSPVAATQNSNGATKGEVAEQVLPDLLPEAKESIHGQFRVRIKLAVNAEGVVTSEAFDSAGPSKYFAKQALQAARQWRFKPAQVGGQAVSSTWILDFRFAQTGTEITPIETAP